MMSGLALRNISKTFDGHPVLHDVTLEAESGEFVALVGPSGCGKSTLLRIAAGLEHADFGHIRISGRDVTALPPSDRDIAMVFQSYALYPHLTTAQNIATPLVMRELGFWQRMPFAAALSSRVRERKTLIRRRVEEAAADLRLTQLLDRKPGQMSGGQRQRVALARAMVRKPQAFLMDEPLSNLDANLRVHTRTEIVSLHRRIGVATLYVTHDQSEALGMADRIAVMIGGHLLQFDTPDRIYSDPAHIDVATFIGNPRINLLEGATGADGNVIIGGTVLAKGIDAAPGERVTLGIRPENLAFADCGLKVSVQRIEFLGSETLVHLSRAGDGGMLVAKTTPGEAARLSPGRTLAVTATTALAFGRDGKRLAVREHGRRLAYA